MLLACRLVVDVKDFHPSEAMLQRSLLNLGRQDDWANVTAALAAGRCLNVATLGGSNTCRGNESYLRFFTDLLNEAYPCAQPAHVSTGSNAQPPGLILKHRWLLVCAGGSACGGCGCGDDNLPG